MTRDERRVLGRFDTPRPLAQAVTDWAIRKSSEIILEPSCGGGVFVRSALSRLSELGARKADELVWGCDIDKRALAETKKLTLPQTPKLILGNFLSLSPSAFNHLKFDAILGNPPYVRLHTMDEASRKIARQVLPTPELLGAKASLWAYFPIHAYKLLAVGGRMGWILPETILHADYGKEVLRWATQRFERCIAASLRERCFIGDGAKERVVILLLQGAGSQSKRAIELVEYDTALEAIHALPHLASTDSPSLPQLNGHAVPHLVSATASTAAGLLETSPDLKRLGDFADVKIGVVTGNNKFFVLDEAQRLNARLPKRHFRPAISKFAHLGKSFVLGQAAHREKPTNGSSIPKWLLCPNPKSADSRLRKYLELYKKSDIATNRTMEKREHWQSPLLGNVPDAFLRYMGKNGPRIVLNEAGYFCTNTIHCIFFKKPLSKATRQAICLSLHSSYSQLSAEFEGRQYGSGVLKLEPSETKRLAFAMNEPLAKALSSEWHNLTTEATTAGWEKVVKKIDALIAEHCPSLAKALPLDKLAVLLENVRQRRNSHYLATGT